MDAHIDIQNDIQESTTELAERLARDTLFRAVCEGNSSAMSRVEKEGSTTVAINLRREIPFGQRQVESLLCFMVSGPTEKALEDAEGDNVVYDGLGEHRVLGKKKKAKKSRTISY